MNEELLQLMMSFVSDHKKDLFKQIIPNRMEYLTVVLEDIYQPHNASAVIRSAECFGVQSIHVIENKNEFSPNKDVVMGASKWVNIHKYNEEENNTVQTIQHLKSKGYRVVATTPHENDTTIDELDITKGPIALMFGSEAPGLTKTALDHADEFVKIPMYGFTESYNISVSAALCLYELTKRIRKTPGVKWELSAEEQKLLTYDWAKKVVKESAAIERRFLGNLGM